jgi:ATP-dependent Clp protease ATP-binding subunit ClpA
VQLSDQCRTVIANAQEVAHGYNHNYVGTEHLLLALLKTPGVAAEVLQSFGITAHLVDAKIIQTVGVGNGAGPPPPLAPRGKRAVDLSEHEARTLGHDQVDSAHLLLALSRDPDGLAAQIVLDAGGDPQLIRDELLRRIATSRDQTAAVTDAIEVTPSPQVQRLLMTAAARALDDGRSEIAPDDVLLALTRDQRMGPRARRPRGRRGGDPPRARRPRRRRNLSGRQRRIAPRNIVER